MFRWPHLAPLAAVIAFANPARAVPIDPSFSGDRRLEAKVSLLRRKTPVDRVLREVQERTGVSLTAAPEVSAEPVIVVVAERPAREVLSELAALLQFQWRRTGQTEPHGYQLYQDLRSRRLEATLRDRGRVLALQTLKKHLQLRAQLAGKSPESVLEAADRYDDAAKAGTLAMLPAGPEYELMRRERSSRSVREMAGELWRFMARFVSRLTPEEWDEVAAGKRLWFSSAPAPGHVTLAPAIAAELRRSTPNMMPPGLRVRYAEPDGHETAAHLERLTQDQWSRADGHRLALRVDLKDRPAVAELKLTPTVVAPNGFGGDQTMGAPSLDIRVVAPLEEAPDPPPPSPQDPVLLLNRPWKASPVPSGWPDRTWNWLHDELFRMAETYGINLIADAYRHERITPRVPDGPDVSLRDLLDAYLRRTARWTRSGPYVLVRRRQWYCDRYAHVPEAKVGTWEGSLMRTRSLTTAMQVRLVLELRDEQHLNFVAELEDRGISFSDRLFNVQQHREFLRAYGNLTAAQQRLLEVGGEVPSQAMPEAARRRLWAINAEREWPDPPRDEPGVLAAPTLEWRQTPTADGVRVELVMPSSPRQPLQFRHYRDGEALPPQGPVRGSVFVYRRGQRLSYFYALPQEAQIGPPKVGPEPIIPEGNKQ
jgi:hypothetical protein